MALLVGIATSHGLRFELDARSTLGRSPRCGIVLVDVLVSAHHAEIRRDAEGRYKIADLGATHGTFVNGTRITEAVLADGDEIIVGATRMRFEADRAPRPVAPSAVSVDEQRQVVHHRVAMSKEPFPSARDLDLPAAYERLRIAYEISRALAGCRDLDELLRTVLDRVFELLPAARGAILLVDPATGVLAPRVAAHRTGEPANLTLPRSILDEVVGRRVGVLSGDAAIDPRFRKKASVTSEGVRSALSVPMVHGDDLVGVIYVDAVAAGLFDELDLEMMATVGGQAGLAVMAARLRAAIEDQARMAAVGQVAAGLAHDFANVMTTVVHGADLIRRAADASPQQQGSAKMIATAADHAIVLTRKLAALARGGGSEPRVVDLAAIVEELADLVRRVLGDGIDVAVHRTDALCPVLVDRSELEQIVLNLAFNARDAMAGTGRLELSCALDVDAGRVVLTVTDSGAGMPPEVIARVFEPFFTTRPHGSGMGLAIVHRLVTASRGTIAVHSAEGRGTAIRMAWPPSTAEVGSADERAPAPAAGARVLVVDDDDAVRRVILSILERAGYAVTSAARGEDALRALATGPFAALIVDVVLVGMSGRQVAERARGVQPDLRVLYLSGFLEAQEVEELTAMRAEFLAKPFGARELEGRLESVLRGEQVRRGRRRPGVMARFATGAAFLESYDAKTDSFTIANAHDLAADDTTRTVVVRFDDAGREFRVHGRVLERTGDAARIALAPGEDARRELILASARGESLPYFRRAEPRYAACIEALLTTESGLVLMSHTQDVSARGLMFSTDHRLEIGVPVTLRLGFPDRPDPIGVGGRVRSTVRTGPRRGLGIEFHFDSAEHRTTIAAAVAELDVRRA